MASAADLEVLKAVSATYDLGVMEVILVGEKEKIQSIAKEHEINVDMFEIIDVKDANECAIEAVKQISTGNADILMKGLVDSGDFLRAVLNKEYGIKKENSIISAIAVMELKKLQRLVLLTDPGFTPLPDKDMKVKILNNAVDIAKKMGIITPKVGMLCAAETVNPKIIATVEAKEIEEMNQEGTITGCEVAGPISLDLALSKEAAEHKGYNSPVAGSVDILVVPTLEVGNVLYKSLSYFAEMETGGVMTGAKVPIVFTSRADSARTKANTIALAIYLA